MAKLGKHACLGNIVCNDYEEQVAGDSRVDAIDRVKVEDVRWYSLSYGASYAASYAAGYAVGYKI